MTIRLSHALVMSCVLPLTAAAQEQPQNASLLAGARQALNNLEYRRAETFARQVVASDAPRDDHIQGLQLLAAAFFPEEDLAQRPDSAMVYLRSLLAMSPHAAMPAEISWPGLDGLLDVTRKSVFAARAEPKSEYVLTGVNAEVVIPVVSTRSAWFSLSVSPRGSSNRTVVDAVELETEADLRLKLTDNDRPVWSNGEYELWITSVDSATLESVEMGFVVVVDAPTLGLVNVPATMDSSRLLPEYRKRNRTRNTVIGVGLGAATGLIATAFRGEQPVSTVGLDNRAYVVGGAMTLGGIIGVFTDREAPLPSNIAQNAEMRADYAEYVRKTEDENEQRRLAYRATVTVIGAIQ